MTEQESPIKDILETAIQNIKNIADVNTIVGSPIVSTDGTTVIPVSKVSLGFASGGSDFATKEQAARNKTSFGGGSGAGVKIDPVAFLVIKDGATRVLPVAVPPISTADRVIDMIPDVMDKVEKYFDKKKEKEDF